MRKTAVLLFALFVLSSVVNVSAGPLNSFAENPIPYWVDASIAVDVTLDSVKQTVTIDDDNDYSGFTYYSETFTDISDWAFYWEGGLESGEYDFTTDGDIATIRVDCNDVGDEAVQYREVGSWDTGLSYEIRAREVESDMNAYIHFKNLTNTVTLIDVDGSDWTTYSGVISDATYADFNYIYITAGDRDNAFDGGNITFEIDYIWIGLPELDIGVPVTPQSIQSIELMGNFSALDSTVRFQMYESGLWCDVNSTQVTFPDAAYAEFTDLARINFSLNEEIRIFTIYVSALNMTLINYYSEYVGLANKDYLRMTDAAFNGSYTLFYINGDTDYITVAAELSIIEELFLSTGMIGYIGPLALVFVGYLLVKKDKGLGVIAFIVISLFLAQYLALVGITPDYWWHIFILFFGMLFTVVFKLWDR